MRRIQVQLDDDIYHALCLRAERDHKSLSAVARTILADCLGTPTFCFIGSGASGCKDTSVRHDDALADDFK